LLFISVWLCDTAAFFFGTKFGKKKILPNISPKKSWVGSISGFIFSMLTFFIAYKLDFLGQTYSLADCIIFGFISGIFGQLGDFGESLLKRDVGVKDSGDILRGHGGILDRFDSLLFSSPLIYIYLIVFNQ
jgi:phosphatidate cytidylyltransferase